MKGNNRRKERKGRKEGRKGRKGREGKFLFFSQNWSMEGSAESRG